MALVLDERPFRDRGGRQQRKRQREENETARAGEEDEEEAKAFFDSELAEELVRGWSYGKSPASDVRLYASKGLADQRKLCQRLGASELNVSKSLKKLAGLGSDGRQLKNCNRDLINYLGEPCVPKPSTLKIHMKKRNADIVDLEGHCVPLPALLPHLVFAWLFTNLRDVFISRLFGTAGSEDRARDRLESFWTEVEKRKDPRLKDHPMKTRQGWKRNAIPILLHGDAVPVTAVGKQGTKSMDCLSWQSLMSFGSTLWVTFLIYAIFEQSKGNMELDGFSTMDMLHVVVLCV